MTTPDDADDYLGLVRLTSHSRGDPALWEGLVQHNPFNETYWSRLGEAREESGDFRGAIEAWRKAVEMGAAYPADAAYNIARCHGRLGEVEDAALWVDKAFAMGYRDITRAREDPFLLALHGDSGFRQLVGLLDNASLSRTAGWQVDLKFLAHEVKRKSHHVLRKVSVQEFESNIEALSTRVSGLSNHHLYAELIKLIASLGDGHSEFFAPDEDPSFHQALPLKFFLFEEGVHITATGPGKHDLVGAKVTHMDDRPVQGLMEAILPTLSRDNEYHPKETIPYRLRELPLLHSLGLIRNPDKVKLTLDFPDSGIKETTIAADGEWPTRDFLYALPCPSDWAFLPRLLAVEMPIYLKNAHMYYWFEHLPKHRAIYFQFNRVLDGPSPVATGTATAESYPTKREHLNDFTERMMSATEADEVQRLIIDVRFNRGGNTFLVMALLHRLIQSKKLNREGGLFVIIGRRTFSAAQNFVSLLDRHTHPIFVGEPTGSSPNFVGESTRFQLPYSGARLVISDLYHQSSWAMDYRTWLAPHIYVPPSFKAFAMNRDDALEAILSQPESQFHGLRNIAPATDWIPRQAW